MSYTDLLSDEVIPSNFIFVLKPRRRAIGFTLVSGSTYSVEFTYGQVSQSFNGDVSLALASSSTLSDDQFYYDEETSILFVQLSGSVDPNSVYLVAEYEMYFGTYDANHYRVPNDSSTRIVYYEPIVTKSPITKQAVSDSLFGFNPVQTLQLSLNNSEHIFDRHIYDSSFNDASIEMWHWLGDPEQSRVIPIENLSLVLKGIVKNISMDQPTVSISLFDRNDLLSNEWRNVEGESFFSIDLFPTLDPLFVGRCIRTILGGPVDGHIPVGITYVDENQTNTDNRQWVTHSGQSNLATLNYLVGSSSTTTRTFLTVAPNGINIGDSIWLDKASDEFTLVTDIGSNYVDHDAISTPAMAGDHLERAFIGSVTIFQDNIEYTALYGRDYDVSAFAGTTSGFTFSDDLETNLSIANPISPIDRVFCRVYGHTNNQTLDSLTFGVNDPRSGNMNHPAQIILDVLKNQLEIPETDIDTDSFTQSLIDVPYGMAIVMPKDSIGGFDDYSTLFSDIVQSSLMRLIVTSDGKFSLSTYKPIGSTIESKDIADDEILASSISFTYNYDDLISDLIVQYDRNEDSISTATGGEIFSSLNVSSDIAKYVHQISKSRTDTVLWTYETEALQYANRIMYVFGDRSGICNLQTKNRFFDSKLGDIIQVQRTYLPGNNVDGETIFTKKFKISSIQKGISSVTMDLDDQKGAEDNSGVW